MCNHNHKYFGKTDLKTGLAPVKCLECGENLGEKPASFQAVLSYCAEKRIKAHYPTHNDYNDLPYDLNYKRS